MYKPLDRRSWSMYAELRKTDPQKAKEFKTHILKESISCICTDFDYYEGKPIIWKAFRPYDEDYNNYDCLTEITTIMHRFTAEDERKFREYFWIHFHDPYRDGRDCTGAPFTGWMKFLRCKDRTIIIHKVNYDY